ncbi:hypothetical protein HGRIS_004210 [Hohenbuehelia grisea]|uniref:Uncharacterized protein n=1 Tax=Hohenbuehelia grisea TaxID=104357 RepID=A0ABR3JHT7_9AGAR
MMRQASVKFVPSLGPWSWVVRRVVVIVAGECVDVNSVVIVKPSVEYFGPVQRLKRTKGTSAIVAVYCDFFGPPRSLVRLSVEGLCDTLRRGDVLRGSTING